MCTSLNFWHEIFDLRNMAGVKPGLLVLLRHSWKPFSVCAKIYAQDRLLKPDKPNPARIKPKLSCQFVIPDCETDPSRNPRLNCDIQSWTIQALGLFSHKFMRFADDESLILELTQSGFEQPAGAMIPPCSRG